MKHLILIMLLIFSNLIYCQRNVTYECNHDLQSIRFALVSKKSFSLKIVMETFDKKNSFIINEKQFSPYNIQTKEFKLDEDKNSKKNILYGLGITSILAGALVGAYAYSPGNGNQYETKINPTLLLGTSFILLGTGIYLIIVSNK